MLPPRDALRTSVKELLARKIVRGELSPGAPLNLAELAAVVGVSVTPLREALIELERDGLVHSILNRGYFVRPLDEAEMRELYPIVAALETLALKSGPPSAARLRELDDLNGRLRRERSPGRCIELDERWHSTLLADCPNATLLRLLPALKRRLYRYEYLFMSDATRPAESVRQHAAIAAAIRKGTVERAAALLEENWQPGRFDEIRALSPARAARLRTSRSRR
ncbi:MAG TPA: GntR family transcriptional regulator [Thermoanaerobaculia bacterium]|nr:GntR family transcriptional regulator [Thermoanaerobaculia bacterium]